MIDDVRGRLHVFEAFEDLPFIPKRVFLIEVREYVSARGGHANSCIEVVVALRGGVTVELDNGAEQQSFNLICEDEALWISAGVVVRLTEFRSGSLLLVFASEPYAGTQHFATPQPHLIADTPVMP